MKLITGAAWLLLALAPATSAGEDSVKQRRRRYHVAFLPVAVVELEPDEPHLHGG
jgi:hypothetical protein